jgi:hypothetical protein
MPRKLKLSPLQSEIMRLLEEAGGEDLVDVANAVKHLTEGPPEAQLALFEQALHHLVALDLIYLAEWRQGYVRLSPEQQRDILDLRSSLRWDDYWVLADGLPSIGICASGRSH